MKPSDFKALLDDLAAANAARVKAEAEVERLRVENEVLHRFTEATFGPEVSPSGDTLGSAEPVAHNENVHDPWGGMTFRRCKELGP